jgi:hypothetical protein
MHTTLVRFAINGQMGTTGMSVTHQELLEKLAYTPHTDPNGKHMHAALKAIVELHKPDSYDGKTCEAHEQCWGCGEWGSDDQCECRAYPCTTIQAITKELQ